MADNAVASANTEPYGCVYISNVKIAVSQVHEISATAQRPLKSCTLNAEYARVSDSYTIKKAPFLSVVEVGRYQISLCAHAHRRLAQAP